MKNPSRACLLLISLAVPALLLTGCGTRSVEYDLRVTYNPDMSVTVEKRVRYLTTGMDTSAALVTIGRDERGNPTLTIENYRSEDMGARAISEGFKAVQAVAGAAKP